MRAREKERKDEKGSADVDSHWSTYTLEQLKLKVYHTRENLCHLHRDPVVKRLKRVWPCDTPDCDPWNANQSIMVLLTSGLLPLCTRQTLKRLVVTSSSQIKAKLWTPDDLFPWLIEAKTLTGVPSPENLLLNDTYWQLGSSFVTCMSTFPFSTARKDVKI